MEESAHSEMEGEELRENADRIALAAIKYADLSNQASKDYVFDIDKFTSFEGNTGPYIMYTVVRIKSILRKYGESGGNLSGLKIGVSSDGSERSLALKAAMFNQALSSAIEETAPHKICSYIYELSNEFNSFYHENKILTEEDGEKKGSWIALITLVLSILETSCRCLGFEVPERM